MIELSVYRAAFVPALLAAVLAMFSLQDRPRALPQGLAADVLFDGRAAAARAEAIAEANPDRAAGQPRQPRHGSASGRSAGRARLPREEPPFSHAGRDLVNVVGRRAGLTRRQIVVVAERDASVVPDAAGSAADTAALLELARVFEGRATRKTLVLASTDGSTLGEVGAIRLAEELGSPALVDAVLVVSDLGAPLAPRPVPSGMVERLAPGRHRAAAHRGGLDPPGAGPLRRGRAGALGQLARLVVPARRRAPRVC